MTDLENIEPSVGIFWQVAGTLVIDRSTLPEAEAYGDCLTCPSSNALRQLAA